MTSRCADGVNAVLAGARDGSLLGRALGAASRRITAGAFEEDRVAELRGEHGQRDELLVLGSGNLGLVYVSDSRRRLTLDELAWRFPGSGPWPGGAPGHRFRRGGCRGRTDRDRGRRGTPSDRRNRGGFRPARLVRRRGAELPASRRGHAGGARRPGLQHGLRAWGGGRLRRSCRLSRGTGWLAGPRDPPTTCRRFREHPGPDHGESHAPRHHGAGRCRCGRRAGPLPSPGDDGMPAVRRPRAARRGVSTSCRLCRTGRQPLPACRGADGSLAVTRDQLRKGIGDLRTSTA